jgi:hypothetical protein
MVQVVVHEVIDVAVVWDRFMPASQTMDVALLVSTAGVIRRARRRVGAVPAD